MTRSAPRLLLFALFALLPGTLQGAEIVRGQTALYLFKTHDSVSVTYEGKEVPLLQHPAKDRHIALIPVDYRTEPGKKRIVVTRNGTPHTLELRVLDGNYPSETLKVSPSKVSPDPAQQERIAAEYAEAMAIYRESTPKRYWKSPFAYPMTSPITSRYGNARLFNGTLRSYHSGTDFKAAVGTPVHAINDGVVVLAKERFYAGGSVIVDHGEGLYSCYYHLSRIDVTPGTVVKKGSEVGLSGQSGRVTGPHLHFSIMFRGVQVAPLQFLEILNGLFNVKAGHR